MNISEQIRSALRKCGEPMTIAQLTEANNWDIDSRKQASKNLCQMKARGEVVAKIEDGKAAYDLVGSFVAKRASPGTKHLKAAKPEKSAPVVVRKAAEPRKAKAEPKPVKRHDVDLLLKIEDIAGALDEALSDAIDGNADGALLKHLLTAYASINRAARAVAAV